MQDQELEFAKRLSDDELVTRLTRCVKEDREVTARLLVHLGEVDARGLFRDRGFNSMFDYAVQALHMSESEAWLRIRSARLAREFPMALGMIARGELHMTALKLLAPVLTPSNVELLDKARFKSKLEIQSLIAKHFPMPDVPSVIRKLPTPKPVPAVPVAVAFANVQLANAPLASNAEPASNAHLAPDTKQPLSAVEGAELEHGSLIGVGPATSQSSEQSAPSAVKSVERDSRPAAPVRGTHAATSGGESLSRGASAGSIVPLSEGRYKVQFTADESLRDKFNEARDLLQNQVPNGALAVIVASALDLLIAERKKQRFAQTSKPRVQRLPASAPVADKSPAVAVSREEPRVSKPNTRHISHAVRRQVYERDAGCCCFVSTDGRRCGARRNLEFHHITPFARGGAATLDNICLMCRAHNALMAERDYGREFVKRRISDCVAVPSLRTQERRRSRDAAERLETTNASAARTPVSTRTIGLGPDRKIGHIAESDPIARS
jgi:hypothetical protein